MVAVEKLARLGIASLVAVLALALALANMPDQGELTHLVHVHDPTHNSVFVHVLSYSLHSFIVTVLVFYYALKYYVGVT